MLVAVCGNSLWKMLEFENYDEGKQLPRKMKFRLLAKNLEFEILSNLGKTQKEQSLRDLVYLYKI
jgi:hypothetical protein